MFSCQLILEKETLDRIGVVESDDPIPEVVTWITGENPVVDKRITLVLPQPSIIYGKAVYYTSPQPKGMFESWIRDCLFLANPQHIDLMQNLEVENMILQFDSEVLPQHLAILKEVRNVMLKGLKNNRISHRPLLLAIAKLDELIRALRLEGIECGIEFPEEAPSKNLMGPKSVKDHLEHVSDTVFPLPELKDLFEGTIDLAEDLNKKIMDQNVKENKAKLEAYQKGVQAAFFKTWKLTADGLVNLKNLLNLFL